MVTPLLLNKIYDTIYNLNVNTFFLKKKGYMHIRVKENLWLFYQK